MSFMTLRLVAAGVKAVQTETLVTAAITASNLIRWREGLPEKLGGWATFYGYPVPGPIRELWAWEDLNSQGHLAAAGDQGVVAITNNSLQTVGPLYQIRNPTAFATTAGSPLVVVTDVGSNTTTYDAVSLQTPVSVGGIVIYPANYPIVAVGSPDSYTINIGQNAVTTSSTSSGATITTAVGSAVFTVTLNNHGLTVGKTFAIVLSTLVGGVSLSGFYVVSTVIGPNSFTFMGPNQAVVSDTEPYGNVIPFPPYQLTQWIIITQALPGGGWGDGGWGLGAWGEGVPGPAVTGTPVTAVDWCMENFGSALIINPEDGPLFSWDPTSGLNNAVLIGPGPAKAHGFFIAMPQQMIVAYGASTFGVQDPMLVAWCDAGNDQVWTAAANNQAGTYRLTRGSKIVGGIQGPLQSMLWTDVGLWLMQYIGFPDVWGFLEISRGCGLIAKKAVAVVGTQVYWMSRDGFWMYAGGGAMRLQCDVWDVLKTNLNLNFLRNIRANPNTGFDEISWECPSISSTSGENDIYVKYNVVTNEWDYGYLAISEWIDQNVFGNPISAMPAPNDSSGNPQSFIMQHEEVPDANGQPLPYMMRTGYFQLAEGEQFVFCDYCIPDFKWKRFPQDPIISAQVQLTFFVNDWPDDDLNPPIPIGPITVTNRSDAVDIRCRGRYFSLQIAGNDLGSFMRLGGVKFRVAPDGRNPN